MTIPRLAIGMSSRLDGIKTLSCRPVAYRMEMNLKTGSIESCDEIIKMAKNFCGDGVLDDLT